MSASLALTNHLTERLELGRKAIRLQGVETGLTEFLGDTPDPVIPKMARMYYCDSSTTVTVN